MDFGILVQFIAMAERYNTIWFSQYDKEEQSAHVYFENGEEWHFTSQEGS